MMSQKTPRIVIFSDDDIYHALSVYLCANPDIATLERVESYTECYSALTQREVAALILQPQPLIVRALDFIYDMDRLADPPCFILCKKVSSNAIAYALSSAEYNPYVNTVASLMQHALRGSYQCQWKRFQPALCDRTDETDFHQFNRQEALKEILRGCNPKEIDDYIRRYQLDLRGNGYYLFFWELQHLEYHRHKQNKEPYYYMGDILEQELRAVLSQYEGGEICRLTPNKRCIIINDINLPSKSLKAERINDLIEKLSVWGNTQTTSCYLSARIDNITNARSARDQHEFEISDVFFLHEESVMRPHMSKNRLLTPDIDMKTVYPLMHTIENYFHYDLRNPALLESLSHLFFDIIKPSLSFTLYYYCIATICNYIARECGPIEAGVLTANLNPALLRFSSLEEQYGILSKHIESLQTQSGKKQKTKNTLVMQTMEYIANNYAQDLTVPEIATALYVSRTYLSQIFHDKTKNSVIGYIVNYRIEQAKTLLEETDEPICNVAVQVGFHDVKHFSKTFKRITGLSATQFRKQFH